MIQLYQLDIFLEGDYDEGYLWSYDEEGRINLCSNYLQELDEDYCLDNGLYSKTEYFYDQMNLISIKKKFDDELWNITYQFNDHNQMIEEEKYGLNTKKGKVIENFHIKYSYENLSKNLSKKEIYSDHKLINIVKYSYLPGQVIKKQSLNDEEKISCFDKYHRLKKITIKQKKEVIFEKSYTYTKGLCIKKDYFINNNEKINRIIKVYQNTDGRIIKKEKFLNDEYHYSIDYIYQNNILVEKCIKDDEGCFRKEVFKYKEIKNSQIQSCLNPLIKEFYFQDDRLY